MASAIRAARGFLMGRSIFGLVVFVLVVAFINRGAIEEWIRPADPPPASTPMALPDTLPTLPAEAATPDRQGLELLAVAADTRCDGLASLEAMVWEVYPSVDATGRITMRGRAEEGAPRLKDARKAVDGNKHPLFTFYALEQGTNERGNFSSVGRLWPADIESRLSGRGTPNALADVYDVTADRFDVSAILPDAILAHRELYVTVWSELVEMPGNPPGSVAALGSCKVWR